MSAKCPGWATNNVAPLVRNGNTLTLSWTGGGKLQEASEVTGAWTDVAGNPQGSHSVQATAARKFYRLIP